MESRVNFLAVKKAAIHLLQWKLVRHNKEYTFGVSDPVCERGGIMEILTKRNLNFKSWPGLPKRLGAGGAEVRLRIYEAPEDNDEEEFEEDDLDEEEDFEEEDLDDDVDNDEEDEFDEDDEDDEDYEEEDDDDEFDDLDDYEDEDFDEEDEDEEEDEEDGY
ncbi:MAG: hypothetical protein HYX74_04945 [Acidobacteria bacterium]|nr:hypothetical protein [Acidobacteriota bacterium]